MAEKLVRSYDIDDVLLGREKLTQAVGLLGEVRKKVVGKGFKIPNLDEIPKYQPHERVDEDIKSAKERLSLFFHTRRSLLPNAYDALKYGVYRHDQYETYRQIINSGRSNKFPWVDATRRQLRREGIELMFHHDFYKPKGLTSTESKLDVVRFYQDMGYKVEHYDDDPRTAIAIAALFPSADSYLVRHGITSLMTSSKELDQYPNLHTIAYVGQNFLDPQTQISHS